ncbi:phage tail protein [Roseibium algae]|uniref:Phage tail protein n=1 Tax=Roseibium algae TaxID=3123038 RepID=A0ABU8TJV3_9HYPH
MLYMLGTVEIDTRPFSADDVQRNGTADLVKKPVIGGMAPSEFTGDGGETLTISGQLLPSKIGGLTELEALQEMRRQGARFPVMRGDGARLGTFAIAAISESHKTLLRDGVGFVVSYSIQMQRVQQDQGGRRQTVQGLLSLFNNL